MNPSDPSLQHILDALRIPVSSNNNPLQSTLIQEQASLLLPLAKEQTTQPGDAGALSPTRNEQLSTALHSRVATPDTLSAATAAGGGTGSGAGDLNIQDVLRSYTYLASQSNHIRDNNRNNNTSSNLNILGGLGMQVEGLLAAQQNSGATPILDDQARLRSILAEAQRQKQQEELKSLEGLINLKRMEQLHLQEAVLGIRRGSDSHATGSGSVAQYALLPSQNAGATQNKLILPVAQGLLRQPTSDSSILTQLEHDAASSLFGISSLKRKAEHDTLLENDRLAKKRPAQDQSEVKVTFPLPLLKDDATIRKVKTECKLTSYHRVWDNLQKVQMCKEIFIRRLHRNKVKLVAGNSRSLILGREQKGGKS